MTELFLHYLWQFKLLRQNDLVTTDGRSVSILQTGQYNTNSGPDFFNARIKIGETVWAGNVEMHLRSSDFKKHGHETDKAYEHLILHVVYEDDAEINIDAPTLVIKDKFDHRYWLNYDELIHNISDIPCAPHLKKVDAITIMQQMDRALHDRYEMKTERILSQLKKNNNDWEKTFYHSLARNFGFKINAQPFEAIAMATPLQVLSKHKSQLHQLEAILFGQAGMLHAQLEDEYSVSLRNEFNFLKKKFSLEPIQPTMWKFLRMRPFNFPTVRIAQFAALVHRSSHLFSKILETKSLPAFYQLLTSEVSPYWQNHFRFDVQTQKVPPHAGNDSVHNIIINTVVPFLIAYGKSHQQNSFIDEAMQLLENIPPENNKVTRLWQSHGITVDNAARSQAVIQQKEDYCDHKKCLLCSVGNKLIHGYESHR